MDFFGRQTRARKESRRLLWLFGLTLPAVLAVNNVLLCSLAACLTHPANPEVAAWHPANLVTSVFNLLAEALTSPKRFAVHVFHGQSVLWISVGTLASIAAGSYYKMRQMAGGGAVVAGLLGGRPVAAGTDDPDERRLLDVVGEMAIASGMPVPATFVLDCERGINTFAAGHTRNDVAIGVTRGCLKLLNRDELQGVIAHEFSHILNGDTRLNMRLIGLAHGLFWPTILGRVLIHGQVEPLPPDASVLVKEDRLKVLPTAPLGGLLIFLGCFSLPFVRLIKSAICRQREWLADAAAVQFTRNPGGIAGALKKIGGLPKQGRLNTPHAEVASHLYFASCHFEPWIGFLATHPPLAKRVAAIEPQFDGSFPKVKMLAPSQTERDQAYAALVQDSVAVDRLLAKIAEPTENPITTDHLWQASVIRLALPEEIKAALRTPAGAAAIVYALLLSHDDEATRSRQMQILKLNLEPTAVARFSSLLPLVEGLEDRSKLPVAEFAVPALRENDLETHEAFGQVLQQLIDCNTSLDLFEYTLTKMVQRRLRAHFQGPATGRPLYGRVRDMLPQCAVLLSALAHVGNEDEAAARSAFAQGVDYLDARGEKIDFLPRSQWTLADVDAALSQLAVYHEPLRRNVLLACGKTVAADGQVNVREAELLRAIADSLDCPMPPFVDALRGGELAADKRA